MVKKKKEKENAQALPSLALVFGYIAVKDLQRMDDRIRVLARLGYGNQEIAAICGTTPKTVAVRKSVLKNVKYKGAR
jgi:DNA-binding NarL/FixJ family response regulator